MEARIKEYYYEFPRECLKNDLYKHILPPNPLHPKREHARIPSTVTDYGLPGPEVSLTPAEQPLELAAEPAVELASLTAAAEQQASCVYMREWGATEYAKAVGLNSLGFDSCFESGNLQTAFKVSNSEYNLLLQNDVHSNGHTQWFNFKVNNTKAQRTVKFNILNLSKPDSLHNYGMKIWVSSQRHTRTFNQQWLHAGKHISYFKNNIKKPGSQKTYYTLTFQYTFLYTADTVQFAYSLPYTYSELLADLTALENHPRTKKLVKRETLCLTLGGRKCELLTITGEGSAETLRRRKGAVVTARVHPGESVGSWMMKGLIDWLTSSSPEAVTLRDQFVFKLVPMLNPDGVVVGNYRCSLAGCDLNRRWLFANEARHPVIYHAKRLIRQFAQERKLELVCDLHGHSRKKNVFMYGCHPATRPERSRVLPWLLSKLLPSFDFDSCAFNMARSKQSTMRITLFKELQLPAVYTLEASFCGASKGSSSYKLFTAAHLMEVGRELCRALLIYSGTPSRTGLSTEEALAALGSKLYEPDDDSSGSDSAPSEDNFDAREIEQIQLEPLREQQRSASLNRKLTTVKRCLMCGKVGQHQCPRRFSASHQRQSRLLPVPLHRLSGKGTHLKDYLTQTERVTEALVKRDCDPVREWPQQKRSAKIVIARKSWGLNTAGLPLLSKRKTRTPQLAKPETIIGKSC